MAARPPRAANHDLLVDGHARENIRALYEPIFFALDNQQLRDAFAPVDRVANRGKANSRKWGGRAVLLGSFSLFAASAQPLLHQFHVGADAERAVALASAVAGIASLAIGLFGVLYAGSKRKWMQNRYITERLRQFHFQSMIALLPEMLRDPIEFEALRRAHLAEFQSDHIDGAAVKLTGVLEDRDSMGWLFANRPSGPIPELDPKYLMFLAAYMDLRVNAQINFCELKLQRNGLFSSGPRDQMALYGMLAGLTVLGALTLHAGTAVGAVANIPWLASPFLHVLGLWCAAGAMAVRTLEEGFRPQREVERYRQYRSALMSVRDRLVHAKTSAEAIAAMKQLENASYEEMVNFLKAYSEAKFVM